MLNKIKKIVGNSLDELNVFIDDAFIENVESKDILCIVLDSDEVIDLKKVTDASRIINELLDKDEKLLESIYEVDIYSKEKGDE